jgi:hypothetical protein
MYDDLESLGKALFGLLAGFIAALFGVLARHVYADDGFKWRRALWELPVAAFCAICAGGTGELLHLPDMVIMALAGSLGYLGPHVLNDVAKRFVAKSGGRRLP